jgi:hypothetical protein
MPLLKQKWITRADLQANPTWWYCFGDNLQRIGLGGQAKEMRGEPNAFGIPTKASPWLYLDDNLHFLHIAEEYAVLFDTIDTLLAQGDTVVFPEDGFGTGLADLATHAPMINELLCTHLRYIEGRTAYWKDR